MDERVNFIVDTFKRGESNTSLYNAFECNIKFLKRFYGDNIIVTDKSIVYIHSEIETKIKEY